MNRKLRMILSGAGIAALFLPVPALEAQHHAPPSDSAFRRVQERGQSVMGVDQYTSRHIFAPLPDGGSITLTREVDDSAGAAQIREHMRQIAAQFEAGNFTAPFLVHAQQVPGTSVMSARRRHIVYSVTDVPRGATLFLRTSDSAALAAIHEFLAFQRSDHRAH